MNNVKRLLIVDDEETLTFSLYQTFINSSIDCEVLTAASASEAMKRLEQKRFDLVITDIRMPGLSGLDLLSLVKVKFPSTRVIIITAYGSEENQQRAKQLGADYYIEKPFDIHQLKSVVFNLIE